MWGPDGLPAWEVELLLDEPVLDGGDDDLEEEPEPMPVVKRPDPMAAPPKELSLLG